MTSPDLQQLEWIDAHHHLWDLSRVQYPWLMARGEVRFFGQPDPIRKDYLPEHYRQHTAGRIARSIHVQVGAKSGHEVIETAFVNDCSRESGGCFPAAAVVAIDLGKDDIGADLAAQMAFAVTRGARHMIGKSAEENPSLPPFRAETWVRNWRRLAALDLSFDLQLTEDQFEEVFKALQQVPELRVAMCHLASPWDRSDEGFRRWRRWMGIFAGLPNLKMKISGWCMFSKSWNEEQFLEWAGAAVEIFGADRCMLGSNFPVDSLYLDYQQLFTAWKKLVSQCSASEALQLAGQSAADFYRI
jgi:predicted TIM-barrel fold metal-dependent hydrolase